LPFVNTPACGAWRGFPRSVYGSEIVQPGWTPAEQAVAVVTPLLEADNAAPRTASPIAACRPVPFGYHCDWSEHIEDSR